MTCLGHALFHTLANEPWRAMAGPLPAQKPENETGRVYIQHGEVEITSRAPTPPTDRSKWTNAAMSPSRRTTAPAPRGNGRPNTTRCSLWTSGTITLQAGLVHGPASHPQRQRNKSTPKKMRPAQEAVGGTAQDPERTSQHFKPEGTPAPKRAKGWSCRAPSLAKGGKARLGTHPAMAGRELLAAVPPRILRERSSTTPICLPREPSQTGLAAEPV